MTVLLIDDVLPADTRSCVMDFLEMPSWSYGWKSNPKGAGYPFWHKHFAGNIHSDHAKTGTKGMQYDCEAELNANAPLIHSVWKLLQEKALKHHTLQRCYANGSPYGADGAVHTDSCNPESFTAVYYPHETWDPNWGGETVLFNQEESDIVSSIFPKPNRLLIFPGTVPHVARGVSRICPVLRITLMFKFRLDRGEIAQE